MDKIANTLGAAEETPVNLPSVVEHSDKDDFEDRVREFRKNAANNATLDFQDSRINIRTIIETGMEMLPDVVQAVSETQSDKAINAASLFLKTLGDLNKTLVEMNTDVLDKAGMKGNDKPIVEQQHNTTNNILVVEDTANIFDAARKKLGDRVLNT
jgi:hypothetical protein